MGFLQLREQQAVRFEEEVQHQVVGTELKERAILDEQRCAIIDQADYEFIREARSESTVEILPTQLRQHDAELYNQLITELRSRERAHQDTLTHMRNEVEELTKTRRSGADLR